MPVILHSLVNFMLPRLRWSISTKKGLFSIIIYSIAPGGRELAF